MLIGLVGYKQVGKSTAAAYLADKGFTRHNFKDALVAEMKENFPDLLEVIRTNTMAITYSDVSIEDLFEQKPPLMRALMQNYGTEVRRKDKHSYWIDKWSYKYSELHPLDVVTDDVRFLNEAETIKKYGGVIIRLTRPDIQSGGEHQSETEQDSIEADYIIDCIQGDHQRLYTQLDTILNELRND